MAATNAARTYEVRAQSCDTFGRVLCSCRHHHFVADGPAQNGCPGEAVTPPELFLAGVASCGVELVQVIARSEEVELDSVHVSMAGVLDRSRPVRTDLTVFNEVQVDFCLRGVSQEQASQLVESFQRR